MPSKIRHLNPGLRLNERILDPVRRLARMTGVRPEEIVEFLLAEAFEVEVAAQVPAAPPRSRRPAAVIPIWRRQVARRDFAALRRQAEVVRHHAQEARRQAAAACSAAGWAREQARSLIHRG